MMSAADPDTVETVTRIMTDHCGPEGLVANLGRQVPADRTS
jgi:hypothetical protein